MEDFPRMADVLPPGQHGCAKIEHLTITDGGGIHAIIRGMGTRNGTYAALKIRNCLVMSDTDMERESNREVVWYGHGDVLVGGLGLGMVVCGLLQRPRVTSITVVEKEPDVIALVAPALHAWASRGDSGGDRLTVICGDIFTWRPPKGTRYDTLYFDVWDNICADNLPEITRLHRAFLRYRRRGAWMGSWMEDELRGR
jgi:spermidine synthase